MAPTILPGQLLWVEAFPKAAPGEALSEQVGHGARLMIGLEALLFLGFPVKRSPEAVGSASDRLMTDLAGNMMALPVLLAIVMSTLASLSWRPNEQIPQQATEDEVMLVLHALQSCRGLQSSSVEQAAPQAKRAKTGAGCGL